MAFVPRYTISSRLLREIEAIAELRARILSASVDLPWIPSLQHDARSRNVHASTAIEGNPLTLAQVRALEQGRELSGSSEHHKREVLNYFAGLRYIEQNVECKEIRHDEVLALHDILTGDVMEQGESGRYRNISVQVGPYVPPPPEMVSGLMFELLTWWNGPARELSPVLSSAILHYRFEAIHPFADGNGRTGRALALWELYRRGFDTHHIFAVDEYYWNNRPAYYEALNTVPEHNDDLSAWLEYCAVGLRQTLEQAWTRLHTFQTPIGKKLLLRPRQEQLLHLLRDHGGMAPKEIWDALGVSRQGAIDLLNPLLEAGLVERVGGKKTGRYILRRDE